MKKEFLVLLMAPLAFTSCEKDADTDKLDNNFVVYTNYDRNANFSSFSTYYLPDSILIIGDKKEAEYWNDENAQLIINTYATNMANRGYLRTDNKEEADLGLQVSYVKSTYFVTNYGEPQWWWGYPGYWGVPYWGDWGDWYYPYAITYSYSTGSFVTELLNLDAPQGQNAQLPVLWTAYMSGVLSGSTSVNVELAIEAVDQAFTQSAYLNK